MDPISGAVMAGISASYSIINGISQKRKAKQAEAELDRLMASRPEYQRPTEARAATALAIQRAGSNTMPGAEQQRQDMQLAMANTTEAATRAGDPQGAAVGAMAQYDASQRQLGEQRLAYAQQQEQLLTQALMTSAEYSDTEWQMNQYAPYVDAMSKATNDMRDYRQGGNQNVSMGMNAMSNIGMGLLSGRGTSAGSGGGAGVDQAALQQFNANYGRPKTQ